MNPAYSRTDTPHRSILQIYYLFMILSLTTPSATEYLTVLFNCQIKKDSKTQHPAFPLNGGFPNFFDKVLEFSKNRI